MAWQDGVCFSVLSIDCFARQSRALVEASQVANWNLVLSARLTKLVASIKQVLGGLFFCWSLKFRWHISKGEEGTDEIFFRFLPQVWFKSDMHQNHSVPSRMCCLVCAYIKMQKGCYASKCFFAWHSLRSHLLEHNSMDDSQYGIRRLCCLWWSMFTNLQKADFVVSKVEFESLIKWMHTNFESST